MNKVQPAYLYACAGMNLPSYYRFRNILKHLFILYNMEKRVNWNLHPILRIIGKIQKKLLFFGIFMHLGIFFRFYLKSKKK